MYRPCERYEFSSEYTSESEDTSFYEQDTCPRCSSKSSKRDRKDQCSCSEYKNRNGVANGKFGLAYIIETPKSKITKPTGWQIEFQDTPSKIVNNCEKMVQWVNCPPLGECTSTIPVISDYPMNCAKLLVNRRQRKNKSPIGHRPRSEESAQFHNKNSRNTGHEFKCSCCKCYPKETVCIVCEKCKVNASRPATANVLCKEHLCNQNKNRYRYEEIPGMSNYADDLYYEHLNRKDRKHNINDDREVLNQKICKNRHCCCRDPDDFRCKYCHKDMVSDNSKCCESKLKRNFFRAQQKSNSRCSKQEDDLDYVPRKEKANTEEVKKTQTGYQKFKTVIKVCDKEVETNKNRTTQPLVHKTETNTIIAIDFTDKEIEGKRKDVGSLFVDREVHSDDKLKRNFKIRSKAKAEDLDSYIKSQTTGTDEAAKKRSNESVKAPNEQQIVSMEKELTIISDEIAKSAENLNTAETKKLEEAETNTEVEIKRADESQGNSIEHKENVEEATHSEDQSKFTLIMTNFTKMSKKEIFTPDMTPMQKIKLALKMQKQAILESKIAHNTPTESELVVV